MTFVAPGFCSVGPALDPGAVLETLLLLQAAIMSKMTLIQIG
jgi:hypothetical protein